MMNIPNLEVELTRHDVNAISSNLYLIVEIKND